MTTRYRTAALPPAAASPHPASLASKLAGVVLSRKEAGVGLRRLLAAAVTAAAAVWLLIAGHSPGGLSADASVTLAVFLGAVYCWIFTKIDDTFVALGAAAALILTQQMPTEMLFAALGSDLIWLLIAAFVISFGITSSGLTHRAAILLFSNIRSSRLLFHLVTLALVATAFAVPATSGRAALALPIFLALASALTSSEAPSSLAKGLSLLFPTVILLSAVGSFLGAGAHLITSQILEASVGQGFDFARWLILALPLALVSSHAAAELVYRLFIPASDRKAPLALTLEALTEDAPAEVTGPLTTEQSRSLTLLAGAVVLWCTESLHGIHPAVIALLGALLASSPKYGTVRLGDGIKKVPWSLILFMAATLALGQALVDSGAAGALAAGLLSLGKPSGPEGAFLFVLIVIVASSVAHLVIQSRSARSAVLVPIVIAVAPSTGVDPVAAAFISTAAAGFCHTLTSSAKPVAMFSRVEDTEVFSSKDLLRLSAWLMPLHILLILLFSLLVWPALGMPVFADRPS
ncbi:SLC13 family permease [Falsarthrobacter nasiphocae]|uniref:Anion transporter n=1 Tax=Falsarthrobacter nasiphocae TaxID=189863 RepID=A0AAE4C4X0_9MICC|nr:SLC13 family permease [Falsarthrobacter nasiphocae]MDR6891756.1 anion transporter [Falsarthrobacter nasiphocae]